MTTHLDERPAVAEKSPVLTRILRATGPSTGAIAGIVILSLYLGFTQPIFFTIDNFTNLISSNSAVLILALGATFVILSGGLDLSIVAAGAASGIAFGLMLQNGVDAVPAVLGTLAMGCVFGLVNGSLISLARIPFLVVTLGTSSLFASLALVASNGATINVFDLQGFQAVYGFILGDVGGVPLLVIFDIVIVVIAGFVLRFTGFGRGIFAIGSNPEAARLNGINVRFTTLLVYVISGFTAALASLVQVGRLTGAAPTFDATLLLTVIAAVLIGGTAYSGGEGGIGGTVLGVLFLGIIQNGLTLTNVSAFWRGSVNGLVLIVAVALGVARARGMFSRTTKVRKND